MSINKSLILNFSGYTLINLFNSLTPFIVLPILTRNLTVEDIGVIDIFSTSSIFLAPLIGLCFILSISKLYYNYDDKRGYLSTLFTSIFVLAAIAMLISAIVLLIPGLVPLENRMKMVILAAIIYVSLNLIVEGFLLLKRNEEKLKEFAVIRLSKSFLEVLLTIVLLYFIDDYLLRILAILIATTVAFVVVIFRLFKKERLRLNIDKPVLKQIAIFSSPLILHTFFASILNYADRYFILEFLGVALLGKYSVVYQLCMVMSLLINSFNMAWTPHFMKNMTQNRTSFEPKFKKTFSYYLGALLLFGVAIYFLMPFVYEFYVGNAYKVDHSIYATLILAYFFNGLYRFKVSYLFYYENTLAVAKLSFITSAINLILNYICIREWGLYGAAFATLVSYFALYVLLEIKLIKIKRNENLVGHL